MSSVNVLGGSYGVIVSAEDEARMLGQLTVEPEHVLLALARGGRTEDLLRGRGVSSSDVRAAIVRTGGRGDELAIGRVPRSPATLKVLERAFDIAAERGVLGPHDEHLLLALGEEERTMALLRDLGFGDLRQVIGERDPARRPPPGAEQVKSYLFRAGLSESVPGTWEPPPVFERFSAEAQRAVRAAAESAALMENEYVQPCHLLLGCLHVPDSLAASILGRELAPSDMGTLGEAMERARMYGSAPAHQATGIFAQATRRLVAEEALRQAYRLDHDEVSSGHLLLAVLGGLDGASKRIVGTGVMGSGPVSDRIAREVIRALPGSERASTAVNRAWIRLDELIRILTIEVANVVPGWTVRGSGRSSGIRLRVPDSQSEEDYAIDVGWIVAEDGPAPERLMRVTRAALEALQQAIVEHTRAPWPAHPAAQRSGLPQAHAELVGDDINPALRLWYGPSDAPDLELLSHPLPLTQVLHR